MTPGPTLVIKAPGCNQLLKVNTIMSGNTFGATHWSDGKVEAPMLPDRPWLRKSPSENVMFWMDEVKEVGRYHPFGGGNSEEEAWQGLEYAEEPSEEDYFCALDSGVANSWERLKYLRTRIWWKGNESIRLGEADRLPDRHRENLEALLEFYDGNEPDSRLARTELLRELGRFEEAADLIKESFPVDYARVVAAIGRLIEERETRVTRI
jgi:hypothetical protein